MDEETWVDVRGLNHTQLRERVDQALDRPLSDDEWARLSRPGRDHVAWVQTAPHALAGDFALRALISEARSLCEMPPKQRRRLGLDPSP